MRSRVEAGTRGQNWRAMVNYVPATLPSDPRVDDLKNKVLDLLVAAGLESILGGLNEPHIRQLNTLPDWVEKNRWCCLMLSILLHQD